MILLQTDIQLASLQARLDAMHESALLAEDDELFDLEDVCADFLALKSSTEGVITMALAQNVEAAGKMRGLLTLSEGIPSDAKFAWQAKRKVLGMEPLRQTVKPKRTSSESGSGGSKSAKGGRGVGKKSDSRARRREQSLFDELGKDRANK